MPITIKKITFKSQNLLLNGSFFSPTELGKYPSVLFIHGSGIHPGKPFCEAIKPWQEHLAKEGICSFSFYSRGVCNSEGTFTDASLANRLIDANNAFSFLCNNGRVNPKQLFVFGHSMGGHIAVQLFSIHPEIKGIILEAAAAYGKEAQDLLMDQSFTQVIRKTNSWENSPVFTTLKQSSVPVLCMYGQNDATIPEEVKLSYKQAIAGHGVIHEIAHGDHNAIQGDTPTRELVCKTMYEVSAHFIKKSVGFLG